MSPRRIDLRGTTVVDMEGVGKCVYLDNFAIMAKPVDITKAVLRPHYINRRGTVVLEVQVVGTGVCQDPVVPYCGDLKLTGDSVAITLVGLRSHPINRYGMAVLGVVDVQAGVCGRETTIRYLGHFEKGHSMGESDGDTR
jgi:hypothetical protein